LVPSARDRRGTNLVIYPNQQTADYEFEVTHAEIIYDPEGAYSKAGR